MNVWKCHPLRKRYYLLHPIEWCGDIFRAIKFAYQRATRGWCDSDTWNIDYWFIEVMPQMLEHLAQYSHGYPGTEEFDTPEKWSNFLYSLARKIRNLSDSQWEEKNEYSDAFYKKSEECQYQIAHADGSTTIKWNTDEEYEEIKEKFFARAKELYEERQKAFEELGELFFKHLYNFWD